MLVFSLFEKIMISIVLFSMMSIYYWKQKKDCTNAQINSHDIFLARSGRSIERNNNVYGPDRKYTVPAETKRSYSESIRSRLKVDGLL